MVLILRGVPGSGKSTLVKNIREASPGIVERILGFFRKGKLSVFSADSFFINPKTGDYEFDPSKLPQAHGECLKGFVEAVRLPRFSSDPEMVVVDNTNTTVAEIAPYVQVALAYGLDVEILTIRCDPEKAAKRNIHGVPPLSVMAMDKRMREQEKLFPPWWKHTVVDEQ